MLSRPFAFGLVAAACVVAAGGGAYIATLQHAGSEPVAAATQPAGRASPASLPAPPPEPVSGSDADPRAGAAPSTRIPPAAAERELGDEKAKTAPPSRSSVRAARPPASRPGAAASRPPADPSPAPAGEHAEMGAAASPQPTGSQSQIPAPVDVPAEPQARVEREPAWRELTIPADSVVGLQLESSLSSETARVEDRVDATVTREVRVDGHVAIPAGTQAIGTVVAVERGGKVRDRARLGIRFHTLILPDSTRLSVTTGAIYREGQSPTASSSAKIGGAAIGGAIIGTILGGGKGAAIGGGIGAAGGTAATMAGQRHAVVLRAGTPLSIRTEEPIAVTVEK